MALGLRLWGAIRQEITGHLKHLAGVAQRVKLREGSQTAESWYKGGAVGSAGRSGALAPKLV